MENLRSHKLIDNPLEEMINTVIKGKGEHLYAFTRDAAVHLSGEVTSREIKREVAALVEKFPGIQFITNHIRVKLPEERRKIEHF